jgi:hypothetical protein
VIFVGRALVFEEGRVRLDLEMRPGAPRGGLVPSLDRGEAEQTLRPR